MTTLSDEIRQVVGAMRIASRGRFGWLRTWWTDHTRAQEVQTQ